MLLDDHRLEIDYKAKTVELAWLGVRSSHPA